MTVSPTPDLDLITLVWRGTNLDGTAALGTLELVYDGNVMIDPSTDTPPESIAVFPIRITKTLTRTQTTVKDKAGVEKNVDIGYASFQVPASNDPDLQGSGGSYTLTENLTNGEGRTYSFLVDKDAPNGIVYVHEIAGSLPNTGTVYTGVSIADFVSLEARVDVIEAGGVGGEGLPSGGTIYQYLRGDGTWQTLDKTAVGLANVTNVAQEPAISAGTTAQYWRGDKSWQPVADLPVSTATQTEIDGFTGSRTHSYSKAGTLTTGTGTGRIYNDTANAWTIASVRASVGTAPTGASVIVDINLNGTTIFSTQANRPTIAVSTTTSGKVTNMNTTTVAAGQYLTVDVDQIGSTIAGADLIVQVETTPGTGAGSGGWFTQPRISFVRVGSNDLPADVKAECDFVCDGVNDQVQINQALALATRPADGFSGYGYGGVQLVGPTFSIADDNATSVTMHPSTTLQGGGWGTVLHPKWASSGSTRGCIELLNTNTAHVMVRDLVVGRAGSVTKVNGSGIKFVGGGVGDYYDIKDANDPYNQIDNVMVCFLNGKGIWLTSNTGSDGGSRESQVRWCHVKTCAQEGIYIDGSSDSQISDCRSNGNSVNYAIGGGNTKVSNCKAYYAESHGFLITSSRVELSGLAAQDNGEWGFRITGAQYCTAAGLAADSNSRLSTTAGGFYIDSAGCYVGLNAHDREQSTNKQMKGFEFSGSPQGVFHGMSMVPSGGTHITGSVGTGSDPRIVRVGSTVWTG